VTFKSNTKRDRNIDHNFLIATKPTQASSTNQTFNPVFKPIIPSPKFKIFGKNG
jgi:hypothetical protein